EDDANKEAEEVTGTAGNERIQATQEEINKVTEMMDESLIDTNLTGNSRDDIMGASSGMLDDANVLNSTHKFKEAILAREKEGTTGLGMGIAIPHGKSTTVKAPTVAFGIHANGVAWQSLD